jgi:hypothetical protein
MCQDVMVWGDRVESHKKKKKKKKKNIKDKPDMKGLRSSV